MWCVMAPGGTLIEETATPHRSDVPSMFFDWATRDDYRLRERYWKRDRAFLEHMRRRGYMIVQCTLRFSAIKPNQG